MSPLAIVALDKPAPSRLKAVVWPEKPFANAVETEPKSLPVPAEIDRASSKAFWLSVIDEVAVSKV